MNASRHLGGVLSSLRAVPGVAASEAYRGFRILRGGSD
jgi:hypothetical protein